MRQPLVVSGLLPALISLTALMWLLWSFIPFPLAIRGLITVVMVAVACQLVWTTRRGRARSSESATVAALLPDSLQGPVVLVCGDGLDALFPTQPVRHTAQGAWLRAGNAGELCALVRELQTHRPALTGQLAVMYCCLADKHNDEAVLRAGLKNLRQQIRPLTSLTGFALPVLLDCRFSGPDTPWVIVHGNHPFVCPENAPQASLEEWQQTASNLLALPVLNEAVAFIRQVVMDELTKPDRLFPPVHPLAVAFRTGGVASDREALWPQWLYRRSRLHWPGVAHRGTSAARFTVHHRFIQQRALRVRDMRDTGVVITRLLQRVAHRLDLSAAVVIQRVAVRHRRAVAQQGDGKPGVSHQVIDINFLSHERSTAKSSMSSAPSRDGT